LHLRCPFNVQPTTMTFRRYAMPAPGRLFISYSHDSPEHDRWVFDLAHRLVGEGFHCAIDQEVTRPAGGWLNWMSRQIDESDLVLVICTERYCGISHDYITPEAGMDGRWECVIDAAAIGQSGDLRSRCVVVLPTIEDDPFIIEPLIGVPTFCLQNEGGYADLVQQLRQRSHSAARQEQAPSAAATAAVQTSDQSEALLKGEPDVIIRRDMSCLACGYNLRTLSLGGICPECGLSIRESMRSAYDSEYRDSDYTIALAESLDVGPDGIDLMVQCLTAGSAARRVAAAYALWRLGPGAAAALGRLTAALRDPDGDVRWWAACALGRIGRQALPAAPALTQLLDDPDEEIGAIAKESLRRIRSARAQ
jgi:hypothetical protein